ncbi:FAD-dependent oxidoreductase [Phyllobacterium myrsinacearum]|uniref:2-polyprenyl-6-methoxyphenol hydroxylase-like FAD-dependent oxidoreductase n=1 Tax=Phyllobacterium myrsinacearum TaxID=28101 RepID=A0A839EP72_9HYPH|nr:FAD-dependent monooxygenase [Phyllobacterium myrsinacearum]MBA8880028.1 2-polyprenyl-6-methoxyphenol hydroxylase-like FAD-dependent oxidoreductase [Phyllobacterium myrsinacearum]
MTSQHVDVAIIGGGPGGLALAQGLKKNGIEVAVFEKDRARTDYVQGFRLRLRQRGLDALERNLPSHLFDTFIDTLGRAPHQNILLNEKFEHLDDGNTPDAEADDTHLEKSVSRITLRQILLTELNDIVQYGKIFSHYVEQPDSSIVAHFEDGSSVSANVLVGADGEKSRVRQQLLPELQTYDTGVRRLAGKMTLAAAESHNISPLLLDFNANIKPGAGHGLMVTSHRVNPEAYRKYGLIGADDATHRKIEGFHFNNTTSYVWWNTAFGAGELAPDDVLSRLERGELIALLLSKIGHWHPGILDLIRYSDPSTVALLRVRTSRPPQPWQTSRVTLLGDAIHSMTYFRALGGNTAIYDAGLLARELVKAKLGQNTLLAALSTYETAMLQHGSEAVRSSLVAMQRNVFGHTPTELV